MNRSNLGRLPDRLGWQARPFWCWCVLVLMNSWSVAAQTLVPSPSAFPLRRLPLPASLAVDLRYFAGATLELSPDGVTVAAAVIDPARALPRRAELDFDASRSLDESISGVPFAAVGSDIWIWKLGDSIPVRLGAVGASTWAPAWSPSGRRLAFLSDRGGEVRLWIWDRDRGFSRSVSSAVPYGYHGMQVIRWTSDEQRLLVSVLPELVSMRVVRARVDSAIAQGGGERPEGPGRARVFQWAGLGAPPYRSEHDATAVNSSYSTDLALIERSTGHVRRILRGRRPLRYWLSPDDRFVAFTEAAAGYLKMSVLFVAPLGGAATPVDTIIDGVHGATVSWSPGANQLAYVARTLEGRDEARIYSPGDGARIRAVRPWDTTLTRPIHRPLWNANGTEVFFADVHELWQMSTATGELRLAARLPAHTITGLVPLASSARVWSPADGESVVIGVRNDASEASGFVRVNLNSGEMVHGAEQAAAFTGPFGPAWGLPAVASADGALFVVVETADRPPDLWVGDSTLTVLRRLSHLNPEVSRYELGASRLVEWRDLDGGVMRGALLLPPGYVAGRRYPLIVNIYPGATWSDGLNRFAGSGGYGKFGSFQNFQLLATRGFAVLLADSRARPGRLPRDLVASVLPGINRVIELGIADSSRLALTGHSSGGYGTLALLADTPRFRAAVDYAGVVDFGALYGALDVGGPGTSMVPATEGTLGAHPWNDPLRYLESTPLYRMDRITTPLLIVHGAQDRNVPVAQSDAAFVALRQLGREVTYVRYEGEPHVVMQRANTIDLCERVIAWLTSHLNEQGRPAEQLSGERPTPATGPVSGASR